LLPAVAGSGIIGSASVGSTSVAADEVPAFQEQIVTVLENSPGSAERVWTSPSGKTLHLKPTGTAEDRTFQAEVRRKPNVDALPKYGVIGAPYAVRVETPVYAGFSVDKPEVEHLRPGDKVFILGQVASDHNWLIVGRNDEAIGYVPADRVRKEQARPSAAFQASDARRPGVPASGMTDLVSVITPCRSLSYAIDADGKRLATGTLAACRSAQGGWVRIAEGRQADAQPPTAPR
jgi:hypothetical protein